METETAIDKDTLYLYLWKRQTPKLLSSEKMLRPELTYIQLKLTYKPKSRMSFIFRSIVIGKDNIKNTVEYNLIV